MRPRAVAGDAGCIGIHVGQDEVGGAEVWHAPPRGPYTALIGSMDVEIFARLDVSPCSLRWFARGAEKVGRLTVIAEGR